MKLWSLIVLVFLGQELITTNAILLEAYHQHYNLWLIHILFVLCTMFVIWLGYQAGKWVQRRFIGSKFITYSQNRAEALERTLGTTGQRLMLVLMGFVTTVYVDSFFASWLKRPLWEIMIFLCIGDLVWYGLEWSIVLGVNTFANPAYAIYWVLGISIVLVVVVRFLSKRFEKI